MIPSPETPMRVAVLFSGRGSNLEVLLQGAGSYEVCVAISNRPDAGGLKIAQRHGVPNLCIDHKKFPDRAAFEAQLLAALEPHDIDLVVLAGFMRVLTDAFIDVWQGRIINIHPSLLPKYPGLNAHKRALESGDAMHGATVHRVITKLDAGRKIVQDKLRIKPDDDETRLTDRTLKIEHSMLVRAVEEIARKRRFMYTSRRKNKPFGEEEEAMKLFRNEQNSLVAVEKNSFQLEVDIKSVVDSNMDTMFGLELICSEFAVGGFRLDSLTYDEENKSFVIVEYKRGNSFSIVDQGYSYLSTMLNNKADFVLEYNETTGQQLKRSDIDWGSSRVIFVAPSFTTHQRNSINFADIPFELWEIKRFDGGLIALEQCMSSSSESIKKMVKVKGNSDIAKVSSEVKSMSEEDHVKKLGDSVIPIWIELKEKMAEHPDTTFSATKNYMTWKIGSEFLCFIYFKKKEMQLKVVSGNKDKSGEKAEGFFIFDDPKNIARESTKPRTANTGGTRHRYWITLRKVEEIDYAMYLLEQKYNSLS